MIASIPSSLIARRICCPKGTRGGLVSRRWGRFQSTMGYRGAVPSFNTYRPPTTEADLDVLEHFELPDGYISQDARESLRPSHSLTLASSSREVPAAVQEFLGSLKKQGFARVFESFKDLQNHGFLRYLSSNDFSNILIASNPKHIWPRPAVARDITHGTEPDQDPHGSLSSGFWNSIRYILDVMAASGHKMTAMDYTGLMSKAMFTRDLDVHMSLWKKMNHAGLRPNTWTYNTRLAMVAGVRPSNRLKKFPLVHNKEYLTFWQNRQENGLKQAMAIYEEMLKNGLFPNTMTIELLAMAHSRVGDVPGISKILQNVYGITIDRPPSSNARPKISRGSPIFPTPKTIRVLAISYCRNANFAAALQAADQLSTLYGLEIDERTWDILLTYSYAFSRPKYNLLDSDTTKRLMEMRKDRTAKTPSLQSRDIVIRSFTRSSDLETLEEAEHEIRKAVTYYRTQIHHNYMLQRDRWVNSPPDEHLVWQREQAMNDSLYTVSMWKDAMGYWLYALLRAHWNRMEQLNEPISDFQTRQINLMEEFGMYWHKYRPLFEPPTQVGEKKVVKPMTLYRYKYPVSMIGVKGYPAL